MGSTPKGISGRWFTIAFGLVLVLGVVIGFSVVVRFQETMRALDTVRQLWPDVAAELEARYRNVDSGLSSADRSDVEQPQSEPATQWREVRSKFQASTQYDVQARLVGRLETLSDSLRLDPDDVALSTEAKDPMVKFLQADRHLESLQSDGLGWLCKQLLRLNIPDSIYSFLE